MPLLCGLLTAVVQGSRFSSLVNLRVSCAVYAEPLSVSHCTVCPATCRRSAFPPTSASHPARSNCRSLPYSLPSLWPLCRNSPARTSHEVFHRCRSRARSHLNTSAYRFLPPRFCPCVHASVALVCYAVTTGYALSLSCKAVWRPLVVIPLCNVSCAGCPTRVDNHTRHIADDIEDIRQYFSVCFVITPVTAPVLLVG